MEHLLHINKILEKWTSVRVGDLLEVKVKLVKDYGVICTLSNHSNGLILNSSLGTHSKEGIKKGDTLNARICDIDYDKDIVDLIVDNDPLQSIKDSISKSLDSKKKKNLA